MENQKNSQIQENKNSDAQSGDPGRTPGSAEGDRETVEADLEEKGMNTGNYGKTKEKEKSESTSSSNKN